MNHSPAIVRRVAVSVAVVALASVGCASPEDDDTAAGCAASVRAAADAVEIDAQKRHLDEALLRCRSVSALTAELGRHPGLIGFSPEAFVAIRCSRIEDEATREGPTCSAVAPTTSAPTTTIVDLVFVGDTLDDRRVEIRPGPNVEFIGEVPAVVQQTVDIAVESDCDGVIAQRDRWYERIGDPDIGDEASVYARHAQNVALYIGCDVPPLPE